VNNLPSSFALISAFKQPLLTIVLTAGLFAAVAHFYAILRSAEQPQVERFTAYGFFVGGAASAALLALHLILGG
jgi:hypothetical protein